MTTAEVDKRGAGEPDADAVAQPPANGRSPRLRGRFVVPAAFAGSGVVLFFAYLAQARTMPTMSDGGSQALQAWDMLHGNVLLHGWSLSDVSFYTTELPEYMLVELVRGLTGEVVHVAAALTYTLLVLLASLLAKGRATGREGLVRVLVPAGIMLAPALGSDNTTFVVLSYPDHTGTQVPLLAIWLLLDRLRPRWWVPLAVAALLAWVQVADAIVLFEGVLPLVIVCAVRAFRRRGPLAAQWFELSLAAGAIASAGAATLALIMIRRAGGFAVHPVGAGFASPAGMAAGIWPKLGRILQLFSADFLGLPATRAVGPLLHLVGFALVAWAAAGAVRRFWAEDDLVTQVLTAALLVVLAAYVFGYRGGAWEAVGLLPLGAVLAGRLLADRLISAGLIPALAAVLACYGLLLLHNAAQPKPFSPNQRVATWLVAHHMKYGLASYWEASSVTLDSGNRVQVRPVRMTGDKILLTHWNAVASWFNPRLHDARFVIWRRCRGCLPLAGLRRAFGPPAMTYQVVHYLVLVWDKNLLDGQVISEPISWNILAAGRARLPRS